MRECKDLFGKIITANAFSFNDTSDHATITPKSKFDNPMYKEARVVITEQFHDYECGDRYIGVIQNKEDFPDFKFNDDVVYISEFYITDIDNNDHGNKLKVDAAIEYYRKHLLDKHNNFSDEDLEIYGRNLWKEKLATLGAQILNRMIMSAQS